MGDIVGKIAKLTTFSAHEENDEKAKDDNDGFIILVVSLKNSPNNQIKAKPRHLKLPYPFNNIYRTKVCLFLKDQTEVKKEFKNIKTLELNKLRTKYESFESKRSLCASYDIFLADDRILPLLAKLIGKLFFLKKKQPIPVKISTKKKWNSQLLRALCGTYAFSSTGTCLNIKVGRLDQSPREVTENLISVVEQINRLTHINWASIKGLFVRTKKSVALSIYIKYK